MDTKTKLIIGGVVVVVAGLVVVGLVANNVATKTETDISNGISSGVNSITSAPGKIYDNVKGWFSSLFGSGGGGTTELANGNIVDSSGNLIAQKDPNNFNLDADPLFNDVPIAGGPGSIPTLPGNNPGNSIYSADDPRNPYYVGG